MHTKRKGNIGQTATAFYLAQLGYSIFTEQGDISKIDLIAEKDGRLIRLQCKAITPVDNTLRIPLKKSGPLYQFRYQSYMFDYFAAFDLVNQQLYLVSSEILTKMTGTFTLRLQPSNNNQTQGIHLASDYLATKILAN